MTAPRTRRRILKLLFAAVVFAAVLAGGVRWLLATESGLNWLVSVAESQSGGKLTISGISRTLIHPLRAELVQFNAASYRITLRDVRFDWQLSALLSGELKVFSASVHDAQVVLLASDGPMTYPDNLHIPVDLNVLQLRVDTLSIFSRERAAADFSATDIEARLINDKQRLELQEFQARLVYGTVSGSGSIGLDQPYVIDARVAFQSQLQIDGNDKPAAVQGNAKGNLKDLDIRFDGNVAEIAIDGESQILPYAEVPLARLKVGFNGANPAQLYRDAPAAEVSGRADLRGISREVLAGSLQLRNAKPGPWDSGRLPVEALSSQISVSAKDIRLSRLVATLAGAGRLSGDASWKPRDDQFSANLKVNQVSALALHTALPATQLTGQIRVEGKHREQRAEVALADGAYDLRFVAERHDTQLDVSEVRLQHGKTLLAGQARLMLDQRKAFTANGQLQHLDLSDFSAVPGTDIGAVARAEGNLSPEFTADVRVDFADRKLLGQELLGKGTIRIAGEQSSSADATITVLDNVFSMTIRRDRNGEEGEFHVDAGNLAQLGYGLQGQVSVHANLAGSLQAPRGQINVHGTNLGMPGGYRIAGVNASGELRSESLRIDADLQGAGGDGELKIPAATIAVSGSMSKQNIQASMSLAQGTDPVGELTLKAGGSFLSSDVPWQDKKWRGSINELDANGLLPFHLNRPAPLILSSHAAYLGNANLDLKFGHASLDDLLWTPQMLYSKGNFTGLNVRIVNQKQLEQVTDPLQTMRFGGSWDITSAEHLSGYLQLQHESGDLITAPHSGNWPNIRAMGLALRAEGDQLYGKLDIAGEVPGELRAAVQIPIARTAAGWTILSDAPLAGELRMKSGNLSWLGPALDKNLTTAGAFDMDAGLEGSISRPRLRGEMRGKGLAISLIDQGIGLEQGELRARFSGDTIRVDRLDFVARYTESPRDKLFADYKLSAGIGQLTASGTIDLEGDNSDLLITAEHLPLSQRADRWIVASGKGHARYAGKALRLDGNIRADAGLINQPVSDRPRLPEDVQIVGEDNAGKSQMPYSILGTLDMGEHFYIRASGLEARLAGNLDVRKEPDEPLSVTGIIAAHEAIFEAYGQQLQVERGMVNFQGKLDDPGLNILALRKGLSVEAGVEVTGTVRRPTVRLVSTPNVPDGEKLSWIMLGRVPESSGVDNSLLVAAASNILGGQTAGQFSRALGVDEISLSQETGTDATQTQKVTVGKRLSTRASISYEKGLNETGGVTKFTYTLTPRITIVTRSGTEDALDLFYSFRFY